MEYTGLGIISGSESFPIQLSVLKVSSTNGRLNVESQSGTISHLEIYNIAGALVFSSSAESSCYDIPLAAGLYIVKAKTGNIEKVEKVVIR
jgi:hypothetical protein